MSLSELENMSSLTNQALKDMPVEFDLDNEGNHIAKISFQDAVTLFKKGYKYREKENEKLKQQNEKLKKCVEFYAEKGHWGINKPSEDSSIDPCDFDDRGGKLARLTLKEIEESK